MWKVCTPHNVQCTKGVLKMLWWTLPGVSEKTSLKRWHPCFGEKGVFPGRKGVRRKCIYEMQRWVNHGTHSVSSVQLLSCVWLFATPWNAACQASLAITNSQSLLKLTSIDSVMPSNHLILCHPLLLLPSIFPSIRDFSKESILHIRWPKYWSFSFNISPCSEYSGLISFRTDFLRRWWSETVLCGEVRTLLYSGSEVIKWKSQVTLDLPLCFVQPGWRFSKVNLISQF